MSSSDGDVTIRIDGPAEAAEPQPAPAEAQPAEAQPAEPQPAGPKPAARTSKRTRMPRKFFNFEE
jgi:hypothetical protein